LNKTHLVDPVFAPWTPEQVEALNAYQKLGYVHEFTCHFDHGEKSRVLVATEDGWHCPSCDYKQLWAHAHMADKAKHLPNPLEALKR
jgi:hypothetical protein